MGISKHLSQLAPSFGQNYSSKVIKKLKGAVEADSSDVFLKIIEDNISFLKQPSKLREVVIFLFNHAATKYLQDLLSVIFRYTNVYVLDSRSSDGTTLLDYIIDRILYEHDVEFLRILLQFGASEVKAYTLRRKFDLNEYAVKVVIDIICAIERFSKCEQLKTKILIYILQSPSVVLQQCLAAGVDPTGLSNAIDYDNLNTRLQYIPCEQIQPHLKLLIAAANSTKTLSYLWQVFMKGKTMDVEKLDQPDLVETDENDNEMQFMLDNKEILDLFQKAGCKEATQIANDQDSENGNSVNCTTKEVQTLSQLCRQSIRNACHGNITYAHARLGLPPALQEFIMLGT